MAPDDAVSLLCCPHTSLLTDLQCIRRYESPTSKVLTGKEMCKRKREEKLWVKYKNQRCATFCMHIYLFHRNVLNLNYKKCILRGFMERVMPS